MAGAELFDLFRARAEAANAEVQRFASWPDAVAALAGWLRTLAVADAPGARALWAEGKLLHWLAESGRTLVREGLGYEVTVAAAEQALVGISEADLAIADTGTVVQDSTDIAQRLVATLPEVHVVLLAVPSIVHDLGAALRAMPLAGPSYWAMVTGPSRTADIERVLTIGAHGPRRLLVLCCDEEWP